YFAYFEGDNRPVEQVSWHDAIEFCARLSNYTKKPYRLPTQAQWEIVAALEKVNIDLGFYPSYFEDGNLPVECVSWNDAQEFCARLSRIENRIYRLPSEAQWEYACRAGATTPFHFGEIISTDLANYDGNYTYGDGLKGVHRKGTTDVGSFPPNAFGLHDMHGNVWEWCQDDWHDNYEDAPIDGTAWTGLDIGLSNDMKVLRGGSWRHYPDHCRSAYRLYSIANFGFSDFGFRVVRST
ncbi:MAG: formylglycine-generating enzyme family protein, partial [Dolichospermum sp.]